MIPSKQGKLINSARFYSPSRRSFDFPFFFCFFFLPFTTHSRPFHATKGLLFPSIIDKTGSGFWNPIMWAHTQRERERERERARANIRTIFNFNPPPRGKPTTTTSERLWFRKTPHSVVAVLSAAYYDSVANSSSGEWWARGEKK